MEIEHFLRRYKKRRECVFFSEHIVVLLWTVGRVSLAQSKLSSCSQRPNFADFGSSCTELSMCDVYNIICEMFICLF